MIRDACCEIPKLEDSISNFQILMSEHIRITCVWSVEDTALIWTLTRTNSKKSLYMQNVTITT